jgi:glycosyltransferase involved in cell wall biosynthesis
MNAGKPAVALFSTRFLPWSQTFVYEEIRRHQRYAVEVFCRTRLMPDRFPFEPVHVGGPLYAATCRAPRFDARFEERAFSLIHAHFGLGAVYALPFARRHRLPLVVTFHGYDVPLLSSPTRWMPQHLRYAIMGPRVLDQMTFGLCASAELRDMLLARGVPDRKLRIHRLGIDLSRFAPGERSEAEFRVLMIGRFVEKKGFEYGIEAFVKVAREDQRLRLTIVGEGPRGALLRRLAQDSGLGGRIVFTGPLPSDRVAQLLATSHLLLAPSVVDRRGDRESGLIVVKEAGACETVAIGTRHGGIPEIIDDGVTGYLVAERDPAGLADRLRQVAGDPGLWRRLGGAAREKMRREYDLDERVRSLEGLYDEARGL